MIETLFRYIRKGKYKKILLFTTKDTEPIEITITKKSSIKFNVEQNLIIWEDKEVAYFINGNSIIRAELR